MLRPFLSATVVAGAVLTAGVPPARAQSQSSVQWPCKTSDSPAAPAYISRPALAPFTDTVRDFRRLPSRNTAAVLAVGSAAAIGMRPADESITRSLSGSRSLHETVRAGAFIGGTPFQLGAAVATYGIGRALKNPCAASLGADLIQAQLIAQALTTSMKLSVRRARPEGAGFSFPSGHATVTFATATVLQHHFGWKVGLPAYAAASYVAVSRIQMKRHYASDIAFGAALGIVAGRTVTLGRTGWTLAPMATPGGGGAAVTWVGK